MAAVSSAHPIRKDVARNRQKIVSAARDAFAADGLDVALEPIAKAAGVGNATLYRHFPTRAALWEAVLVDPLREILALVEEASTMPDAGDGVAHYLIGSMAIEARRGGFAALMTTRYENAPALLELRGTIQRGIDSLIERAVQSKQIRADVTETDFGVIALSLTTVVTATRDVAPDTWKRLLGIILDGLRPLEPTPLPAPPLKPNQVWRAFTRRSPRR
ncbi:TetR/AcrR family transcriptional regulator [soil metagenome]